MTSNGSVTFLQHMAEEGNRSAWVVQGQKSTVLYTLLKDRLLCPNNITWNTFHGCWEILWARNLLRQLSLCSVFANTHLNAKWLFSSATFTTLTIFYLWAFIQTDFFFTQMLAEGLFFIWIPALRRKQGYSLRARIIATSCYFLILILMF